MQAEKLLDDVIDLLFEGGALSIWRYRIVLDQVREGLIRLYVSPYSEGRKTYENQSNYDLAR